MTSFLLDTDVVSAFPDSWWGANRIPAFDGFATESRMTVTTP